MILKLHELARRLEAAGSDNYAEAARKDAHEMCARKRRNMMKLIAANENGG